MRVLLAFAAIYLLWGSNFLAIRYAAEAMPPFLMMGVRSLIAGTLLFAWAATRDGVRPAPGQWRRAAAVGLPLFLGCHGLLAWAEQTVASGVAALVLATIPVFMIVLDWAWGGPRPGPRAAGGLALGLAGLVALIDPRPGGVTPPGLAALVLSAFAWAAGSILSRRLRAASSLVLMSGMQLLAGGAALVIVGLGLGEAGRVTSRMLEPRAAASFAYMVIAASLVGFTAYMWLLRVSTPARVGTYAFVNPVVALFVGNLIGGEGLDARTLFAALVIVAGVALIVSAGGRGARGGGDDRARVEGSDPGRAGAGVPGVPEADGRGGVPAHAR